MAQFVSSIMARCHAGGRVCRLLTANHNALMWYACKLACIQEYSIGNDMTADQSLHGETSTLAS